MKDIPLGHANSMEIHAGGAPHRLGVGNSAKWSARRPSSAFSSRPAIARSCPSSRRAKCRSARASRSIILPRPFSAARWSPPARVAAVEGRRITFEVEAHQGDKLVMKGRHVRAIVSRDRLLGRRAAVTVAEAHLRRMIPDRRPVELTVVVPSFNERDNVEPLVERLARGARRHRLGDASSSTTTSPTAPPRRCARSPGAIRASAASSASAGAASRPP